MKKHKTLRPWIRNLISIILLCIIGYSGYNIFTIKMDEDQTLKIQNEYKLPVSNIEEDSETYSDRYNNLKEINSDFKGWIAFESDLIDLPFLQTVDNDFYLNKNINREYSSHGSVFQDYLQDLNGRNITLYGHYVYNNADIMFTPLVNLKDKANYESNKYFSLFLDNTQRKYEVVGIVKYSVTDEPIYQIGDLSDEKFNEYKDYIYKNRLYDTGVEIGDEDKLLSLQTCVRNEDDTRWLVIGKLKEESGIQ